MLNTMRTWFPGGLSDQAEKPAHLLPVWQSYEAPQSHDTVEARIGRNPERSFQESFGPLLKSVGETLLAVSNTVSQVVGSQLPANVSTAANSAPSPKTLMWFGLLVGIGFIFMMLAMTVFPVMFLAPRKFALFFCFGCAFIMGSFFVLKGPQAQMQHMLSPERVVYSCSLLGSMVATIYFSMVVPSYFFSLTCLVAQMVALFYYVISYFPGGLVGMKFLFDMSYPR